MSAPIFINGRPLQVAHAQLGDKYALSKAAAITSVVPDQIDGLFNLNDTSVSAIENGDEDTNDISIASFLNGDDETKITEIFTTTTPTIATTGTTMSWKKQKNAVKMFNKTLTQVQG